MTNLVIVAGGLGSRLAPLTNYIPKFLVNIGKDTGYVKMVRYWKARGFGTVTVIVHSSYSALVKAYHAMYFPDVELIVKTVDVANGSAHAILSTCSHLNGRAALFTWCDVIPVSEISIADIETKNVVFTNYSGANRYDFVDGKCVLVSENNGGCFGIYHIAKFSTEIKSKDGQDFIDVIDQYGDLSSIVIAEIVDFGDMPKLINARKLLADGAREFNSLERIGDWYKKEAVNSQGNGIIAKELAWYKFIGMADKDKVINVPEVATSVNGKPYFFLKAVPGEPVWQAWVDLSTEQRAKVLDHYESQSSALASLYFVHAKRQPETIRADIEIEANSKLEKRLSEIEGLVKAFGNIDTVNGYKLPITDPRKLYELIFAEISAFYDENQPEYVPIHGDFQMSNAIYDVATDTFTLIDPRGYFGGSAVYGLRHYDEAKLAYSLDGYDLFNYSVDQHILKIEDGSITFTMPKPNGIEELDLSKFTRIHLLWLAVIWAGLAGYIKNDPIKCICSYFYGMMFMNKLIEDKSWTPFSSTNVAGTIK